MVVIEKKAGSPPQYQFLTINFENRPKKIELREELQLPIDRLARDVGATHHTLIWHTAFVWAVVKK
jgi:hypothetical protein